jgi:hypothetical protein
MSEFQEWELHNGPYIDEEGTIEETARVWENRETFDAHEFIDEVKAALDGLDAGVRPSAEIYFRTWTDVDGCPSQSVSLTYRRPATDRELRLDKAKQVKAVMDDRAWLQQRLASLIEDAGRAGLAPEDIGIKSSEEGYVLAEVKADGT